MTTLKRVLDSSAIGRITTLFALASLLAAAGIGFRQTAYINCVGDQSHAAGVRTAAIAKATDNEREAQRRLLANANPSAGPSLRAAVLDAYAATDVVRAAYPPAEPSPC